MRSEPGESRLDDPVGGNVVVPVVARPMEPSDRLLSRVTLIRRSGPSEVPSNWQLHGHGVPLYTNKRYPFSERPSAGDGNTTSGIYQLPLEESGRILSAHISGTGFLVRSPDVSSL